MPQSRRRAIFVCAREGLTLPAMPQPTHRVDMGWCTVKDHDGLENFRESNATKRKALHPGTTLRDVLADLPAFDVTPSDGPAFEIHGSLETRFENAIAMPKHDNGHDPGPQCPIYASGPVGTSNRKLRDSGNCLQNFTVPRIGPKSHRTIWQVALEETEKEGNLPKVSRNVRAKSGQNSGRLLAGSRKKSRPALDGIAGTTIATLKIDKDHLENMHPVQRRLFTTREMARISGMLSALDHVRDLSP